MRLKGIIDKYGCLFIQRPRKQKNGIEFIKAFCVFRDAECSDECPFFGDPENRDRWIVLETCRRPLYFSELVDERHPTLPKKDK